MLDIKQGRAHQLTSDTGLVFSLLKVIQGHILELLPKVDQIGRISGPSQTHSVKTCILISSLGDSHVY